MPENLHQILQRLKAQVCLPNRQEQNKEVNK
jgi:hypothetical protein